MFLEIRGLLDRLNTIYPTSSVNKTTEKDKLTPRIVHQNDGKSVSTPRINRDAAVPINLASRICSDSPHTNSTLDDDKQVRNYAILADIYCAIID